MNNFFFLSFLVLTGLMSFAFISNHYLNLLLSIEFIMLGLLLMLGSESFIYTKDSTLIFLFLGMMIMEGVFSLSLLIMVSGCHGSSSFYMS